MVHIKIKIKRKKVELKESQSQTKEKKTKRNLQKIKPENLLEPLTVNVFNLKKKKGGCRAKLNVFNLKKNERQKVRQKLQSVREFMGLKV